MRVFKALAKAQELFLDLEDFVVGDSASLQAFHDQKALTNWWEGHGKSLTWNAENRAWRVGSK